MHHPLMCFPLAFGICPSRSSLGCEPSIPFGQPSLRRPLARPSTPSTPSSRSSGTPIAGRTVVNAEMRPGSIPLARNLTGSLRLRVPATPTKTCSRGRLVLPCDSSPTGRGCLSRLFPWPESASHISGRIVLGHPSLQRFLPVCAVLADYPPCRFPHRCVAAPRIQARQPQRGLAARPAIQTDAFSDGGVVHASEGSLLSWSFPPFEDDLPASSHTSAGLLSWASIVRTSRLSPCGSSQPTRTCALQSFREPEELARLRVPSSVGFLSPLLGPREGSSL